MEREQRHQGIIFRANPEGNLHLQVDSKDGRTVIVQTDSQQANKHLRTTREVLEATKGQPLTIAHFPSQAPSLETDR